MLLEAIDIGLILLYLLVVIFIGVRCARRHSERRTTSCGTKSGWVVVGLSLRLQHLEYDLGGARLPVSLFPTTSGWLSVILVFFAVYFIPSYLSSRIYTIPEFLELRFSPACRIFFRPDDYGKYFHRYGGDLYCRALWLSTFSPGVELLPRASVLALTAGYILRGWYYCCCLHGLYSGDNTYCWFHHPHAARPPSGWFLGPSRRSDATRNVQHDSSPGRPHDAVVGYAHRCPRSGFYFWCTNQFIVQRVLGARDVHQASWGALFAGLLNYRFSSSWSFPA